MDDFQLVDAPTQKPWCCVTCGSQKGPILNTFCNRWGETIYFCRYCTETAARGWGLIEGTLNREMLSAQDTLLEREKEIATLNNRLAKKTEAQKKARADYEALQAELETALGRVTQFEHLIGEAARNLEAATATPV